MSNTFFKRYRMILICDDSINEAAVPEFKLQFENTMQKYDAKAKVINMEYAGNIKTAYKIKSLTHVNVVYAIIELEHNAETYAVIQNINRKYHKNNHTLRAMIQCIKHNDQFTNINEWRQSIEAIYNTN